MPASGDSIEGAGIIALCMADQREPVVQTDNTVDADVLLGTVGLGCPYKSGPDRDFPVRGDILLDFIADSDCLHVLPRSFHGTRE